MYSLLLLLLFFDFVSPTIVSLVGKDRVQTEIGLTLQDLNQLPQIVYSDEKDGGLKLIKCSDLDCSSSTTYDISHNYGSNVDSGGSASIQSSKVTGTLYLSGLTSDQTPRVWECKPETPPDCKSEAPTNQKMDVYAHAVVEYATPEQQIAYIKKGESGLFYQRFYGIGFGGTEEVEVVSGINNKAHLSLVADDGYRFAFIAFYHPSDRNLWFVRCKDKSCSQSEVAKNVDKEAKDKNWDVGSYVSMDITQTREVFLAYYSAAQEGLRVMKCPDIDGPYSDCSVSTVEDPNKANVGTYTSISVNPNEGKFVVSYYDETNKDLRIASCNLQLACYVYAADSAGNRGKYSNIQIDSLGNALVAYMDSSDNSLKFLRDGFDRPNTGSPGTTAVASSGSGSGSGSSTTSSSSSSSSSSSGSQSTETDTTDMEPEPQDSASVSLRPWAVALLSFLLFLI